MKTGTTFEILRTVGNIPEANELLISVEIGTDMSLLISFNILAGMLFGPEALEMEIEQITLAISSALVGAKSREFKLGSFRKLEKLSKKGCILSLMESAMVVKKSLK